MDDTSALALAARQGGVITRAQAVELGYTRGQIDYRVKVGRWEPIHRSTYRLLPALGDEDLLRGALVGMPGAVVSHTSAGLVLDLEGVPRRRPTVSVDDDHAHTFPGVVVRRSVAGFPEGHTLEVEGIVVTSPARTVVDLAGVMQDGPWDRVAQAAVVGGRCTVADIGEVALVVCGRGRPGSTRVREFLDDGTASLSALERRALALLAPLRPEVQYPAPWNPRLRLDLAFPTARVAVELDGRRWHSTGDRFRADRRRDRRAAAADWVVVRLTWEDVTTFGDEVLRTVLDVIDARTAVRGP